MPAYSCPRRPKINICSKWCQQEFTFSTDQRKSCKKIRLSKTLLFWEHIKLLSLNNDITGNSISFDDNLWDQLSSVCWDVRRILLNVGTSSRLTSQLDRVVCWPELSWPGGSGLGWGLTYLPPICHSLHCRLSRYVQHTFSYTAAVQLHWCTCTLYSRYTQMEKIL